MTKLKDIMTCTVECITPDDGIDEAARCMARFDVGALPVEDDGRVIGIVTDRDLVVRALAHGRAADTPVREVMTRDLIWCREDEPVQRAAEVMEAARVRRLLVLDRRGGIVGIVSLGDVALRSGDDALAEDVLEEVSWPGHPQGQPGGSSWRLPRALSNHRRVHNHIRSTGGRSRMTPIMTALALGAGAMYLFDPGRGRRRRAQLRNKAAHLTRLGRDAMGKTARYTGGRTRGLAAEAWHTVRADHPDDVKLRERVRSAMGRVVSHSRAIDVHVADGAVRLSGPILRHEVDDLLETVASVRGVKKVENHLDAYAQRGDVPALQGGRVPPGRSRTRWERWSPTTRMLGTLAGGAVASWGLKRRGMIGNVACAAGAALAGRSISNLPARRAIGIGAGRRAVDVQKHLNIDAPVEEVWEQFADYENLPHFMSCVREVRDHGNGRSHWTVSGPAGMNFSWDAEITRFEPPHLIAWRTLPGSTVEHAGVIRFDENERGGTRMDVRLSYNPPGGAFGHAAASIFGADARSELDADLMRFKTMLETGRPPHDAAIPAGRTVR